LTPDTSLGFRCVRFGRDVLGVELDPWQENFLVRALETREDGALRFRTVLLLVARQNGKSAVCRVLSAWMAATGRARLVVSTAQDLGIARRLWEEVAGAFERNPQLSPLVQFVRRANGQEGIRLTNGSEIIVKATTPDAARGLSVDLLLLDELRTHKDHGPYAALANTTIARPGSLIVGLSNAGDDRSVVLNAMRESAIAQVDAGSELGIFEWSAPDGCALDDVEAICAANPSLGNGRLSLAAIEAARAAAPTPEIFRTENLCQRVESLDTAIGKAGWDQGRDGEPGMLRDRSDLAAVVDVAEDGAHVTLVVAGREGDRVRVEVAGAWASVAEAEAALPDLLGKIRARREGWFPNGPGGALASTMANRRRAVKLSTSEASQACMGFAELVKAGGVLHPGDPLLTAHVLASAKVPVVDGWRFGRRGAHCDAAYAAAGAVHLARLARVRHDWSVLAGDGA
jgi:hypothetical protein